MATPGEASTNGEGVCGMVATATHWEQLWGQRDEQDVSWFQAQPRRSLELIREAAPQAHAPIIDVGGGASRLVDELLDSGYRDVSVLDVAPTSLDRARQRLGPRAAQVTWTVGDVLEVAFERAYAVWHDRAVFHFLTDPADQRRYVDQLAAAVASGGHVIIATFGTDGPTRCSGLPVQRYHPAELAAALGDDFDARRFVDEVHVTPTGAEQAFVYGLFQRR